MSEAVIRLLALDLDGTVFTDDKRITPATLEALQAAIAAGVVVIPATGRPLDGLPQAFLDIPGVEYALTCNGAAIWRLADRTKLVDLPFSTQQTLDAMALMEPYRCTVDIYIDGKVYTTPQSLRNAELYAPANMREYVRATRHPMEDLSGMIQREKARAEKITMFFFDAAERAQALAEARQRPWILPSWSMPENLELNAAGVDKGRGLLTLAEVLGIPAEQTMACGDSVNDLAMLRDAGLGVAMGNAAPDVQAQADVVTDSNQVDGVAKAVYKYILHRPV